MDDATKQAAMISVLVFNLIVITWMIVAQFMSTGTPSMGTWLMRAFPAVLVGGAAAGGTFFMMKR